MSRSGVVGRLVSRTFLVAFALLVAADGAAAAFWAQSIGPVRRAEFVARQASRLGRVYLAVAEALPDRREDVLRQVLQTDGPSDDRIALAGQPAPTELPPAPPPLQRIVRTNLMPGGERGWLRPARVMVAGLPFGRRADVAIGMADGSAWLNAEIGTVPPPIWLMPELLLPLALLVVAEALVLLWATTRQAVPLAALIDAADRLGRDVNAPPLPETPGDALTPAAAAFNTMASRIRRFVRERTFLLSAIGHDLRTPITRLKLRCEFIEDEEQQKRFLADLDALETMVSATLQFGRAADDGETIAALDLGALLRTVIDEAGDAVPEAASSLVFEAPAAKVTLRGRPVALRRAFANLVGNAVRYAGGATVTLRPPSGGKVVVLVEDDGPGIPAQEMDRVFEPYYRLEASRNRETGGSGLGLPITRDILVAQGGEVTLANRQKGGLRATVTLPA